MFEALTAIADGRVRLGDDGVSANVVSSAQTKAYTVQWSMDLRSFSSNDNGTYWRSYLGYPIIATLIALGRLACSENVLHALRGVNWNALNERHRRDYDAAVHSVLSSLPSEMAVAVEAEVDRLHAELKSMEFLRLPSSLTPPT